VFAEQLSTAVKFCLYSAIILGLFRHIHKAKTEPDHGSLTAWDSTTPTRWIFFEFHFWDFYKNVSKHSSCGLK
jgi:hypothetical protein